MNYINRLEFENTVLKTKLSVIYQSLEELRAYLRSSKFDTGNSLDRYVNTQDVLNRIEIPRSESML